MGILCAFQKLQHQHHSSLHPCLVAIPPDSEAGVAGSITLQAPGSLHLSLVVEGSVDLGASNFSSWLIDASAEGALRVGSLLVSNATITGAGLLRATG